MDPQTAVGPRRGAPRQLLAAALLEAVRRNSVQAHCGWLRRPMGDRWRERVAGDCVVCCFQLLYIIDLFLLVRVVSSKTRRFKPNERVYFFPLGESGRDGVVWCAQYGGMAARRWKEAVLRVDGVGGVRKGDVGGGSALESKIGVLSCLPLQECYKSKARTPTLYGMQSNLHHNVREIAVPEASAGSSIDIALKPATFRIGTSTSSKWMYISGATESSFLPPSRVLSTHRSTPSRSTDPFVFTPSFGDSPHSSSLRSPPKKTTAPWQCPF